MASSLSFPEAGGGDDDVERKGASPFTVSAMQNGWVLGCTNAGPLGGAGPHGEKEERGEMGHGLTESRCRCRLR
jgi:hypothetical protein